MAFGKVFLKRDVLSLGFSVKFEQCFHICDLILVFTYWLWHALSQHGRVLLYFG